MGAAAIPPRLHIFFFTVLLVVGSACASATTITGVVLDSHRAAVVNARVIMQGTTGKIESETNEEGRFSLEVPEPAANIQNWKLEVAAPGFVAKTISLRVADLSSVVVVLSPAGVREAVTVSAKIG